MIPTVMFVDQFEDAVVTKKRSLQWNRLGDSRMDVREGECRTMDRNA